MEDLLELGFVELTNRPSGVYALCLGEEVMYVGQSVNVYTRVREHFNSKQIPWDRAFVLWCSENKLEVTEGVMIHLLGPQYNIDIPFVDPKDLPEKLDLQSILEILGLPTMEKEEQFKKRI